jgi:hypothetical protein
MRTPRGVLNIMGDSLGTGLMFIHWRGCGVASLITHATTSPVTTLSPGVTTQLEAKHVDMAASDV